MKNLVTPQVADLMALGHSQWAACRRLAPVFNITANAVYQRVLAERRKAEKLLTLKPGRPAKEDGLIVLARTITIARETANLIASM